MLLKVRGVQDFLDLRLFNFLKNQARSFLTCNHFTEISTPIIEYADLYIRGLGQETDVVTKQMFMIEAQDEEKICLRPEITASTMRAFLEHPELSIPWKIFSWGPCFRYERPQKGRYRQFHQINIEILDTHSIWQDAYFIMLLDRFFTHSLSLDNYALLINFLGCSDDRGAYKKTLYAYLKTIKDQLCAICLLRKEKNILRVLDCKNPTCQRLFKKAPIITDSLCTSCEKEWQQLQKTLKLLSVSFSHVPTLVRGLDYYDKTVFEFVSEHLGAQSAFCSGGRYDHLAQELGSTRSIPSIGASMGIERLLLLLEPIIDCLSLPQLPAIQMILPLDDEQKDLAVLLADELQVHGLCVDVLLDSGSLKSMMRKADRAGAQHVIIIGSQEQESGHVILKNMVTGREQKIKQIDVVATLKNKREADTSASLDNILRSQNK